MPNHVHLIAAPSILEILVSYQKNLSKITKLQKLARFVIYDKSDIEWLAKCSRTTVRIEYRVLSLRFAFDLWNSYGGDVRNWIVLLKSIFPFQRLYKIFWKATFDRLFAPARGFWIRHIKFKILSKHWWWKYDHRLRKARAGLTS